MSTRHIGDSSRIYKPINTLSKNVAEGLNPEFIRYVVNQSLIHQGGFSTILETIIATDAGVSYQMSDTIPITRYAQINAKHTLVSRLWERGLELIGFLAINNFAGYTFTEATTHIRDNDIIFGDITRITRDYIQEVAAVDLEEENSFYNKAISGKLTQDSFIRSNVTYEPRFIQKEEEKQSPEWVRHKQQIEAAKTLAQERSRTQKQKSSQQSVDSLIALCKKMKRDFVPYWIDADIRRLSPPTTLDYWNLSPFLQTAILYFDNGEHFLRAFDVYLRLFNGDTTGILNIDLPLLAKIITAKVFGYPLGPEIHLLSTNKPLHRLELQALHILGWYAQTGPSILPVSHTVNVQKALDDMIGHQETYKWLNYSSYVTAYIDSISNVSGPNHIKEFCSGQLGNKVVRWVTKKIIEGRDYVAKTRTYGSYVLGKMPQLSFRDEEGLDGYEAVKGIVDRKKEYIAVASAFLPDFYDLKFKYIVAIIVLFADLYPAEFPDVIDTKCPNAYKKLLNQYLPQYLLESDKKHGIVILDPLIVKNVMRDSKKLYTYKYNAIDVPERIETNCDYYPLSVIYMQKPDINAIENYDFDKKNMIFLKLLVK